MTNDHYPPPRNEDQRNGLYCWIPTTLLEGAIDTEEVREPDKDDAVPAPSCVIL